MSYVLGDNTGNTSYKREAPNNTIISLPPVSSQPVSFRIF